MNRRDFIKLGAAAGAGAALTSRLNFVQWIQKARAAGLTSLIDPGDQSLFEVLAPNALDPGYKFDTSKGKLKVAAGPTVQQTGLKNGDTYLDTPVWGYGQNGNYFWPGYTFEVQQGKPTQVEWQNNLGNSHLLPVDTSTHWCYSLHGYQGYTIGSDGVPIVPHLHGGRNVDLFDGNPEQFFSPGYKVKGPRFQSKTFVYHNNLRPGTLWYHDHALGITRLNVYAGLAGFYIVRDDQDTGKAGNPLGLPAWPYELAYAIQDRMFKDNGELFYPAFPGDPYYDDFITDEGAVLPNDLFPGGGPTALAEFFGDHMVVNGKIWPKAEVEPRNYRLRLLNGCDSRFLVIQFFEVPPTDTNFDNAIQQLEFTVIGSDQGLASSPTTVDTLLFETGSRYDIILDFKQVKPGNRVIMKNIGGDAPFGGDFGDDLGEDDVFPDRQTDRIMAFDVIVPLSDVPDASPTGINFGPNVGTPTRTRKVALFEGKDEFERLQPLLGTAEPATDFNGNPINWPDTPVYVNAGLVGQMEGSIAWHSPTTENPAQGSTEQWEIWNMTGDAHPIHLHLVNFEIMGRQEINFDGNADDDGFIPNGMTPADNGVYLVTQSVVQHNGQLGQGFRIVHPSNPMDGYGAVVSKPDEYVENTPKDMVTALPGQVTFIKAHFDRPGRYVWHCHILSHEDHEMMRVLHVGGGATEPQTQAQPADQQPLDGVGTVGR